MKTLKKLLFSLALLLLVPFTVMAKDKINVYIFKGATCGYCAAAISYMNNLDSEYKDYFNLVEYEVWNDTTNNKNMKKVASYFGDTVKGVPYIVIGDVRINEFAEETTGPKIKEAIKSAYYNEQYEDIVAKVIGDGKNNSDIVFIIVLGVVIVGGIVFVLIMSRDVTDDEEEKVAEKVTTKTVKAKTEPKKTTTKKTTTTKATTKKNTTKKSSTKKATTAKNKTKK